MTRKVLVVEDTEDNRKIVRDLLSAAGYELLEAVDGASGLAMATEHRPDLILMDIQLPVMDGYETTRRIKADPALRHIPIIAVTSYALSGDEGKTRAAGCDAYIAKPFSPRKLLETVRLFLPADGDARALIGHASSWSTTSRTIALSSKTGWSATATRLRLPSMAKMRLRLWRDRRRILILLDVMMPNSTASRPSGGSKRTRLPGPIPVILLTSKSDARDVIAGLEAGADEYLSKPIDHGALVARVKAMLRLKTLQDELREQSVVLARQANELAELNADLSARVTRQVEEIERVSRLKRFLAPQVAEAILSSPTGEEALRSHRANVAVVFCDLRGFTAFAETAEPEDVISVLSEYHKVVGEIAFSLEGTLERFAGDGVMVIFNDPAPCSDPCDRAVHWLRACATGSRPSSIGGTLEGPRSVSALAYRLDLPRLVEWASTAGLTMPQSALSQTLRLAFAIWRHPVRF